MLLAGGDEENLPTSEEMATKSLPFEDFLSILWAISHSADPGCYDDSLEGLKVFDKDGNGTIDFKVSFLLPSRQERALRNFMFPMRNSCHLFYAPLWSRRNIFGHVLRPCDEVYLYCTAALLLSKYSLTWHEQLLLFPKSSNSRRCNEKMSTSGYLYCVAVRHHKAKSRRNEWFWH